MKIEKKEERTQRAKALNRVLRRLYPRAPMELNFSTDFECLVAVILSAQCTDKRVNEVTPALFKRYKTVTHYVQAKQSEMEQLIFSSGFYKNKAKHIIAAARVVVSHFKGELPRTLHELITLPGVGRKTANVVLSTLYGITEGIAVDTHVRRFAIRFELSDFRDPKRIEVDLKAIIPRKEWWMFNHRLVLYGRYVCKANKHNCLTHPLTTVYPKANTLWPKAR